MTTNARVGAAWVDVSAKPVMRWTSGAWVDVSGKPRYRWDGAAWVLIGSPPVPLLIGATSNATRIAGTGGTASRFQAVLPVGWASGDFAVFQGGVNSETGSRLVSDGWTVLPSAPALPVVTTTSAHVTMTKVLAPGEPDPWFETSTAVLKGAAGVAVYRNAALEVEAHAVQAGSSTTHTAPDVTTLGADRVVLRCYSEKSSANTDWTGAAAAGELTAAYDGTSGGVSVLIAAFEQAVAGPAGTMAAIKSVASAQCLMSSVVLVGA